MTGAAGEDAVNLALNGFPGVVSDGDDGDDGDGDSGDGDGDGDDDGDGWFLP